MYIIDHYENTEFQSSFYSPNLIWFGEVLVFSNWSKDTLSLKFLTAIFNKIVKNNLMKLFSTYFVYWRLDQDSVPSDIYEEVWTWIALKEVNMGNL